MISKVQKIRTATSKFKTSSKKTMRKLNFQELKKGKIQKGIHICMMFYENKCLQPLNTALAL